MLPLVELEEPLTPVTPVTPCFTVFYSEVEAEEPPFLYSHVRPQTQKLLQKPLCPWNLDCGNIEIGNLGFNLEIGNIDIRNVAFGNLVFGNIDFQNLDFCLKACNYKPFFAKRKLSLHSFRVVKRENS